MKKSLGQAVGRGGYFTLAFGAIVGSGWIVVLGEWLRQAGPGGTVLAFMAGALVMCLIARSYGELAVRFPRAGGEFLYVHEVLGPRLAFLVGWYLTLYAIAVCAFEGIAIGWILRTLCASCTLGIAYTVLGTQVTWDSLLVGMGGAALLCGLHLRGAAAAIRFQNLVTFGFIVLIASVAVVAFVLGKPANLEPLFEPADGGAWQSGCLWIFGTCAFFLNGWQTALHAIEERRADLPAGVAVRATLAAILAASLFYIAVVLAAGYALAWREWVNADLPAVSAFGALSSSRWLGLLVLVAAAISLGKAWSAMLWLGSRLLYAQACRGLLPAGVARTDTAGAPRVAIVLVTGMTMLGIAAGRAAVLPIVNMVSICIALSFILCLMVLLRLRRSSSAPGEMRPVHTVTIGSALAAGIVMVAVGLAAPWVRSRGAVPVEWWLLGGWGLIGVVVSRFSMANTEPWPEHE